MLIIDEKSLPINNLELIAIIIHNKISLHVDTKEQDLPLYNIKQNINIYKISTNKAYDFI